VSIEASSLLRLSIFAITYFVIAVGKFPRLRLDRAGAALVGATAMVLAGRLDERAALAAIDFHTLVLLFGMMIVVAELRLSGVLEAIAGAGLRRAHNGYALLGIVIGAAGVLAAFFINDIVCLTLAPLLLDAIAALGVDAEPYLLGLATASNIGSAATITGNPQNMIVAGYAHLRYAAFAIRMAPIAIAGLVLDYLIIAMLYRESLGGFGPRRAVAIESRPRRDAAASMARSGVIAAAVLAGFVLGYPTDLAAIGGASLLLLSGRRPPAEIYQMIDWMLLLLFAGLFIVVAGAETTGFQTVIVNAVGASRLQNPLVLASTLTVLSNLVSNVPAVILFQPIYRRMGAGTSAALLIAAASTLAGNLTIVGSIANLIVVEAAAARGIAVTFGRYVRVGLPLTAATLLIAILLLRVSGF